MLEPPLNLVNLLTDNSAGLLSISEIEKRTKTILVARNALNAWNENKNSKQWLSDWARYVSSPDGEQEYIDSSAKLKANMIDALKNG